MRCFASILGGKVIDGYKVITLCGGTRFKDEFMETQKNLTLIEARTLDLNRDFTEIAFSLDAIAKATFGGNLRRSE